MGIARAFWLKVTVAFGLAYLAVIFLPGDRSGDTPPADTLLFVAVTIGFLCTVALVPGDLPGALGGLRARPDLDPAAEDGDAEVIRYARLSGTMLRFRVAAMVWLFMLLGAALHDGLAGPAWCYVLAALSLGAYYVAATALNDIADEPLDRVNHPAGVGRPLVNGEAVPRQLLLLAAGAGLAALAASLALGWRAAALVAVSLSIAHTYSLPPLRFLYRTYLAPLVLGVGYVLVPYLLGVTVAGSSAGSTDLLFAAGLYALFVARIVLKDFRDRKGDSLYGRPTTSWSRSGSAPAWGTGC